MTSGRAVGALALLSLGVAACGGGGAASFVEYDRGEGEVLRVVEACANDAWQITAFTTRDVVALNVEFDRANGWAASEGDLNEPDGPLATRTFFISIPVAPSNEAGKATYGRQGIPFTTTPCGEALPVSLVAIGAGQVELECVKNGASGQEGCVDLAPAGAD